MSDTAQRRWKVAIIGAGPGGLCLAARLKRAGISDFVVLERSDGVGGTWRQNTYPGAACDVPSHYYSYSFDLYPNWSRSYATQPEILSYFERFADAHDLRPHIRSNTEVVSLRWSDPARGWLIGTAAGDEIEAQVVVSAIGTFNTPHEADLPGLDGFAGAVFHSARWDHDRDLHGRRVGVIGTGASAVQIVPAIAPDVAELRVFQRTPAWIVPRADVEFSEEEKLRFRRSPLAMRRLRFQTWRLFETTAPIRRDHPNGDLVKSWALANLEFGVPDPVLRAALTPDYPTGCKRILVSSDFYPTLQRENVQLVTSGIDHVTADGIVIEDGTHHGLDAIVLATGFRAADYLSAIDVRGAGGRCLHDDWAEVPYAYLGMAVPGYPNFFMMYGPNTNQGGNSIIFILEAQARYITSALKSMRRRRLASMDAVPRVTDRYRSGLATAMKGTVWTACASYFANAKGHVATQLPHRSTWYWLRTRRFRPRDYVKTSRRRAKKKRTSGDRRAALR